MLCTAHQQPKLQRGFTLVEVMVVAPVVLLAIAVFIGIIVNLTGEILVTRNTNSIAFNTQDALNMIEQDVRISAGFLATNSISPLISPQGYNNATQNFQNASGSTEPMLILRTVGLTDTSNANRKPVWLRDQPNSCGASNVGQNDVMLLNTVYFLRDNTLWRRTIMPTGYASAGCSTPDQRPSCHPDRTETICVARDVKVLSDVSEFSLNYFTPSNQAAPLANATNVSLTDPARQTALDNATTVRVTLKVDKVVSGRDVSYGSVMRTTRAGSVLE